MKCLVGGKAKEINTWPRHSVASLLHGCAALAQLKVARTKNDVATRGKAWRNERQK